MDDRTSLDAAARAAAGDDGTSYDDVAIALHWAAAFLVFPNFLLAGTACWHGCCPDGPRASGRRAGDFRG